MPETILFVFAGRKPNLELQLPLVERILADNPDTVFHVWNLTRTRQDNEFVRGIEGDRITVLNDFATVNPWRGFNRVYQHYSDPEFQGDVFVKIDDDVVFLEADRFADFVEAIPAQGFLSGKVINNGACTATEPELWDLFESLGIPLLNVHQSADYAELAHRWFFDNWRTVIDQPAIVTPTDDWLSINVVGYTWEQGRQLAAQVGEPSPPHIAGRDFPPTRRGPAILGDEGCVNLYPRFIHEGFTAAHLYFGPQAKQMQTGLLAELRKHYADIGREYLCR